MAKNRVTKEDVAETVSRAAASVENTVNAVAGKVIELSEASKAALDTAKGRVVQQLDQNGDGQLGIDDVIALSIKAPGVHITRAAFLQKELFKNHPQEVIDRAIASTPALAGISIEELDKIADEVIKFERLCVSGISAALGVPGGWAMAAAMPADILQYYGYTLRAVQKLLYLYGFPEIDAEGEGIRLDSETINTIILCLGVMNGVACAKNAIQAVAKALAVGVEKQLMKQALTKGALYPFIKGVMKWFGVNLTKGIFTGAIKKAIPVVGGVVGGGITFLSFKPCCDKLKAALRDTQLSNPDHVASAEETAIFTGILNNEVIDVDFEDVEPSADATEQGSKDTRE